MLEFIGLGSAFNTKLGNTSAYIKKETSFLLIDCGGSTFERIKEKQLLKGCHNLSIIITHLHPDHIGSLGDLIFYAYYILNIKPVLYYPDESIKELFKLIGVEDYMVELSSGKNHTIDNEHFTIKIEFIEVSHIHTMKAYGFLLKKESESIYYSGDANQIPQTIIDRIEKEKLIVYQDTCGIDYDGNAHLSFSKLKDLIPKHLRKQVFCIHLDEHININELKDYGFQIPTFGGSHDTV